jgi:antitoxin component of MazEF toxin-antitoxin module
VKPIELKVAKIGNSRGVRLPAATLRRYRIGQALIMEERSEGIMLRPTGPSTEKLSWEETAREMAVAGETWSEWDAAVADGLEEILWDAAATPRVAERKARYRTGSLRRSGAKK